ncbi:maleylpyruvate isomerase N-terminal domain-containing protein [Streptomyces nojiriensis]|uniref:maleylpyruvate isomerase N-terminal domain-containing protein n=1 Tax=Streptomyces nojiriensis TaxID=66374 RepID=UPI0035D91D9E
MVRPPTQRAAQGPCPAADRAESRGAEAACEAARRAPGREARGGRPWNSGESPISESLEFSALLQLIDERSAAFRSAVAAAPGLDAPAPSCPEWTLFDLVHHLGTGQRWWAAIVAAGRAEAPPAKDAAQVPHEPATIHHHATEGRSWLLALDGTGAWPAPLTDDAAPASASAAGTAEQLIAGEPEE